jgi:hypothetical protein
MTYSGLVSASGKLKITSEWRHRLRKDPDVASPAGAIVLRVESTELITGSALTGRQAGPGKFLMVGFAAGLLTRQFRKAITERLVRVGSHRFERRASAELLCCRAKPGQPEKLP